MNKEQIAIIYVLIMITTLVIVDILFFKHRFLERLIVNIGIVLLYTASYLAFFKK